MGKVEECSKTLCREGVGRRCLLSWPVDGDTGPSIKRGRFGNTSLNGNRESPFIQGFYFQKPIQQTASDTCTKRLRHHLIHCLYCDGGVWGVGSSPMSKTVSTSPSCPCGCSTGEEAASTFTRSHSGTSWEWDERQPSRCTPCAFLPAGHAHRTLGGSPA